MGTGSIKFAQIAKFAKLYLWQKTRRE